MNARVNEDRRRRRERGAAATIVAVLLAGGVLMGMAALTIDVGAVMFERRQLQNGADAAAMAFADICAKNAADCDPTKAPTLAQLNVLLDANAVDRLSQLNWTRGDSLNGLCGRKEGTTALPGVPVCASAATDAAIANLAECPPVPAWLKTANGQKIPYVEAYSLTESSQADTRILPYAFAQTITGNTGTTVGACARAAWGPASPSSMKVIAFTMSECDWMDQTGFDPINNPNPTYPPTPVGSPGYDNDPATPAPPWPTAAEQIVFSKGNDTTCETSSPGGTAPGGFAWLDDLTGTCSGMVDENQWVHGSTGAAGCEPDDFDNYLGTVVKLPVFDCMASVIRNPIPSNAVEPDYCTSGLGENTNYHVSGYAAFYLTGWKLTKGTQASIATGRTDCGGADGGEGGQRCLFGWFVKNLEPAGEIDPNPDPDGTPNYGITAIQPAG